MEEQSPSKHTNIINNTSTRLKSMDKGLLIAWAMALVFGLLYSRLSLQRHWAFNTHAFDLGLFHQVTWNTYDGNWFAHTYHVLTIPTLVNHMGDHVQPILWPISWLYTIHDGAETLLVLQAIIVCSGIVPIYLLGRKLLRPAALGVLFGLIFVLHPALQAAILYDFHPITLAPAFLLWAFYFAEEERYLLMGLFVLLALMCKENVSLIIALFGVYLLLRRRIWPGISLLVVGLAWFLMSFFVILPTFNPGQGSSAFTRYQYLGDNWSDVVVNLITHPQIIFQRLTERLSITYLISLFAPLGFLSLFAPQVLLVAASELGLNLLSSFDPQRTINYQYTVMIVTVAVVAAMYGLSWIAKKVAQYLPISAKHIMIAGTLFALFMSLAFHYFSYGNLRPLGPEYIDSYQISAHDQLAERFIVQIPTDAIISAQSDLAPHVSQREITYVFPTVLEADYVFLDTQSTIFPVHLFPIDDMTPEQAYREYIRQLLYEDDFTVVDYEDGWALLKRGSNETAVIPADLQTFLNELP